MIWVPLLLAGTVVAWVITQRQTAPGDIPIVGDGLGTLIMQPEVYQAAVETFPLGPASSTSERSYVRAEPALPLPMGTTMGTPGAFAVPRGYAVSVIGLGPDGWVRVTVKHPDRGELQGWMQTSDLMPGQPGALTRRR